MTASSSFLATSPLPADVAATWDAVLPPGLRRLACTREVIDLDSSSSAEEDMNSPHHDLSDANADRPARTSSGTSILSSYSSPFLPPLKRRCTFGPAPPLAPTSFDEDYVLPAHADKPLLGIHPPHPIDALLRFYEKPHIYTYAGVPTTLSVTALAHAYEKPFIPSEAIALMKKSFTQVREEGEIVEW